MPDIDGNGWVATLLPPRMKPNIECRRLAELLREKAKTVHDAELRAEHEHLVRGFLRLATQFEQDMAPKKVPHQRPPKTAA